MLDWCLIDIYLTTPFIDLHIFVIDEHHQIKTKKNNYIEENFGTSKTIHNIIKSNKQKMTILQKY